ncbi:MAG: histidinol-phosphate transaminase [Lactobacillales bacterium]|nr:histidinol-phosphate transaminase [Lactobacillales bacterium]
MMKGIRKITPYIPGKQPNFADMIKINTNENAFPPSPKVKEALAHFSTNQLKLYSSLTNESLTTALAEKFQLKPKNFLIGNGSDEVLAFCFLAFFNSDFPVLFPDITYGFYKVWGELFHIPFEEIPLDADFQIDFSDYNRKNGGIILTNPNAPTGDYHTLSEMKDFLKKHSDEIVVVDEAYIDFGGESLAPLVNEFDNLIVVQTFSKAAALAGLRVGYAVGNAELISILNAIKSSFNPYSVDILSEKLATAAVKDEEYYKKINAEICQTREYFTEELAKLGFQTVPSKANFILTTHPERSMKKLFEELTNQHIFVRYFDKPQRLASFLRITIGTREEMEVVLNAIKKLS